MSRIVVLGGGFGGTYASRYLDQRFRHDDDIEITLVSRDNYMVFAPLLPEVAGNIVEPRHAAPPLRGFLKKAHFHQGEVRSIDVQARTVTVEHTAGHSSILPYDYLMITLGSATNYHHAPGAAEYSYDLKSLNDAIRLRNHVLATLELADVTSDPEMRQALLTFLAAGGGYAGLEGLGQLIDFIQKALPYYPSLRSEELRFILASRGEKLLDEVDDRLGTYVVRKLRERGVDIRLGVTVKAVTTDAAELEPGGWLPTCTVLWAAGITINPLIARTGLPINKRGAVVVDSYLQVIGRPEIFAVGDCAAIPDGKGGTYAPTAQNAMREATLAAKNLVALIHGGRRRPFRYKPIGSLASLGHYQAVAQLFGVPFSGFPAWLAWRLVYLYKLPAFSRKVRVSLDWILEALLPTDIVQLPVRPSDDLEAPAPPSGQIQVETPKPLPSPTEAKARPPAPLVDVPLERSA